MGDKTPNIQVGNKVLFVGGPEAGNVRVVPESHGDMLKADNDYVYKIWPLRMAGNKKTAYFAYAADQHPLQMFMDMWREYSPVAQIKRNNPDIALAYQSIKRQDSARAKVGK